MVTDSYSGIVLDQNATASGSYPWRATYNGNWVYQTFTLPASYTRGTSQSEQIIPDISGFQVLVAIDSGFAATASLDYVFQVYEGNDTGWNTLANGTVIGAHADGSYVWFDVIFPKSVPVSFPILGSEFRLGVFTRTVSNAAYKQPVTIAPNGSYLIGGQSYALTLANNVPYPITVAGQPAFLLMQDGAVTYSIQQGISTVSYVSPTPLQSAATGLGQAYQSDGITRLLGGGTTACLNFRLLGLVADSGANALGNEYRSAVTLAAAGNTSTTQGLTPVGGAGKAPYYMSPPQPSQFAVVSLYHDMRPVPSTPQFGAVNAIGNPSFEYDPIGNAPAWWTAYTSGGSTVDQTVQATTWSAYGVQSLHMKYTFTVAAQTRGITSGLLPISPTTGGNPTPIALSMSYNIISNPGSLDFTLLYFDSNMSALGGSTLVNQATTGTGIGNYATTTTVPANAAYVQYQIAAISAAAGTFEGYVDGLQVTYTSTNLPYFDGDQLGCQWTAQRGASPSAQVIDPEVQDDNVVLNGVVIDPLTPNMICNVYYSSDDANQSATMSERDWEGKLWTRVPQVYRVTQRQQYVFPQPITCKYVKVEFTNLPAQSYDPGAFQKPVAYKKYPTWVANYFLAQLELPPFTAGQVNVVYDALRFAYDYYLDDLDQSPATPIAPPTDITSQLTSYFNATPVGVDGTTLAQITLIMQPYQQAITSNVDRTTSLGHYVSAALNQVPNATENSNLAVFDYSTVSSLAREPVVLEQSLPAMFFFLTCRHGYKELMSEFAYNRAYFAGVNDIAFIRSDYTTASDTAQYIEPGGDQAHIQSTDWVLDEDGNWYVYGS